MKTKSKHKLVDGTLIRESDGVVAICICGWKSKPYFTSFSCSAAFMTHQESNEEKDLKSENL